jgi:hypothetical protein
MWGSCYLSVLAQTNMVISSNLKCHWIDIEWEMADDLVCFHFLDYFAIVFQSNKKNFCLLNRLFPWMLYGVVSMWHMPKSITLSYVQYMIEHFDDVCQCHKPHLWSQSSALFLVQLCLRSEEPDAKVHILIMCFSWVTRHVCCWVETEENYVVEGQLFMITCHRN